MAEWRAGLRNYHIKPAFSQTLRESQPHILGSRKNKKKKLRIMKIKVLMPSPSTTASLEIRWRVRGDARAARPFHLENFICPRTAHPRLNPTRCRKCKLFPQMFKRGTSELTYLRKDTRQEPELRLWEFFVLMWQQERLAVTQCHSFDQRSSSKARQVFIYNFFTQIFTPEAQNHPSVTF